VHESIGIQPMPRILVEVLVGGDVAAAALSRASPCAACRSSATVAIVRVRLENLDVGVVSMSRAFTSPGLSMRR